MTSTNPTARPFINMVLVRTMERAYNRAITAEENATTEAQAYRLAAKSQIALRNLQAARAGRPLPKLACPMTPSRRAKAGMIALGKLAKAIARAIHAELGLKKAAAMRAESLSQMSVAARQLHR